MIVGCGGHGYPSGKSPEEKQRNLYHALKLAAATQLLIVFAENPAEAIERKWKPRRHHRRLGEEYTSRPILDFYLTPDRVILFSIPFRDLSIRPDKANI